MSNAPKGSPANPRVMSEKEYAQISAISATHAAAAKRGMVGIEGLNRDEQIAIIAMRLRKATEAFIAKHGGADQYSSLMDLMAAMQVASSR